MVIYDTLIQVHYSHLELSNYYQQECTLIFHLLIEHISSKGSKVTVPQLLFT